MIAKVGRVGSPHHVLQDTLLDRVIDFVYQNLPGWRDVTMKDLCGTEEDLTHDLHDHLSEIDCTKHGLPIYFHLEYKQNARRRIDMAVMSSIKTYAERKPIVVIEAKRLPAPSKNRSNEYVTGAEKKCGGIQRFKMCLHGSDHCVAAMIGYVQKDSLKHHYVTINDSIEVLRKGTSEPLWTSLDKLINFKDNQLKGVSRCVSKHHRTDKGGSSTRDVEISFLDSPS